jgi:large subunit ribosomal protein L13
MKKKTYSMKASEVDKKWFVIDATDLVLGRLAALVATRLRGKHYSKYTPSMDCGDNIIIINADKVYISGNKADRTNGKKYYWHTGYMGGIKETTVGKMLEGKFPERVLKLAIQRMLPKESPLARKQLTSCYIYASSDHPHIAQQPEVLDVSSLNIKNKKRK